LKAKLSFVLPFLACLLLTVGQLAAARLDQAAMDKRAKDNARALRGTLPIPEQLGEQWKRPWEMPSVANWYGIDISKPNAAKKPTEEDFLDAAFLYDLRLPFGMSESEATALYDDFVEMYVQTGGGQSGMTQREFLNYYLAKRQAQDASAAQKAGQMWSAAARGLALQLEKNAKSEFGDVRHKVAIEMFGSRFAGLSEEQFKAAWVRQMTLVRRYTFMGYVRCANWQAPPPISWSGMTRCMRPATKPRGEAFQSALPRLT